jgi:hypothetical protein
MGGRITANGALVGIGSAGQGAEVEVLTFAGSGLFARCTAGETKVPVNASSIVFSNASVIFETPGDRLFGVNPSQAGSLKLTILFGTAVTNWGEPLSGLTISLLQIGSLSPVLSGDWALCVIAISGNGGDDCVAIQSAGVHAMIVTVGSPGIYSVSASNATVIGLLATPGGVSAFEVASDPLFEAEGVFGFVPRPTPIPISTGTFTPALLSSIEARRTFIISFGWFVLWVWIPLAG